MEQVHLSATCLCQAPAGQELASCFPTAPSLIRVTAASWHGDYQGCFADEQTEAARDCALDSQAHHSSMGESGFEPSSFSLADLLPHIRAAYTYGCKLTWLRVDTD